MTWQYRIRTGTLKHDGVFEGTGYSGLAGVLTRNNPGAVNQQARGPIPPGRYSIGTAYNHPRLGPIAMPLEPLPGNEMFGRSEFFIHGDNARHDASHGCVILGPALRRLIDNSSDHALEVIA